MRFSTLAFSGLVAFAQLAVAADEPAPELKPNNTELSSTLTSTSLSPTASCIAACDVGDVDCQAKCVGVAHPNSAQANQTTECAAKCNQGDGSPKAVQEYADCQQACINSYFPIGSNIAGATGTGAKNPASASATATGKGARETGASATATNTSSGARSSSTGAANSNYGYSASLVGLGGLFMGLLAL